MERFDVVRATFQPMRRDDLAGHAVYWVGVRIRWQAGWLIDAEDGGPYAGDWAMVPLDPTPQCLRPIGWVPLRDLASVESADA